MDYGSLTTNPSFNLKTGSGLQPVGKGHGFDLGLAAEVGKAVRLGLALTDLGHMTWTGNLLTANDQKLKRLKSEGIGSYNFIKEAAEIFASGTDSLFQYQTGQERRADLPTKLRAGAGVRISEYFEAGLDVTLPLNNVAGNLPSPFVGRRPRLQARALGAPEQRPDRRRGLWSERAVGLHPSPPRSTKPVISTRDVVGLLTSEHPYLSVAGGFLRFKFGGKSQ